MTTNTSETKFSNYKLLGLPFTMFDLKYYLKPKVHIVLTLQTVIKIDVAGIINIKNSENIQILLY